MGSRRLLVSDLDGTLLGDADALARFSDWIGARRAAYVLAYASGRHLPSIEGAIATEGLPAPDAIVSAVGTEIHGPDGAAWPGWLEQLSPAPIDEARALLRSFRWLADQPAASQTPRKASYLIDGATATELIAVDRALEAAGIAVRTVPSGGVNLDVIPAAAGKGRATAFLADALGIDAGDVLVFGDSGNDLDMLSSGFRGTVVANGLLELDQVLPADVYRSTRPFADGVLDGIRYWTTAAGTPEAPTVDGRRA